MLLTLSQSQTPSSVTESPHPLLVMVYWLSDQFSTRALLPSAWWWRNQMASSEFAQCRSVMLGGWRAGERESQIFCFSFFQLFSLSLPWVMSPKEVAFHLCSQLLPGSLHVDLSPARGHQKTVSVIRKHHFLPCPPSVGTVVSSCYCYLLGCLTPPFVIPALSQVCNQVFQLNIQCSKIIAWFLFLWVDPWLIHILSTSLLFHSHKLSMGLFGCIQNV
jgi:hypothetical protein